MDARTRLEALDPAAAGPAQAARLHGLVSYPLTLEVGDLARMGGGTVRLPAGAGHGARCHGVPLRCLVGWAEPRFGEASDARAAVIVALGRTGDRALFSWTELMDTVVGDGVHVVFDHPDAPLDTDTGPVALVSLNDRHARPRFVRRLRSIELRLVAAAGEAPRPDGPA